MERKMDSETLRYAKEMIEKKGYDEFTASKVLDYIDTHDTMYGHIIDTKDVVDRISENLNKNIKFDFRENLRGARGGYRSYT